MDCAWVDRPKLHPGLCQRVERNGQLLCGPTAAPAAAPAAPFPTLVAAAAACAATSAAAAALAAGDAAAALSTSVGACRAFRGQRDH